jgi:hypothetical protein
VRFAGMKQTSRLFAPKSEIDPDQSCLIKLSPQGF